MKKLVVILIVLVFISSCGFSKDIDQEECDLLDHKQVMDEMAFVVGKLRAIIHTLGTETNPDFSLIKSDTSDLLETTRKIHAPSCLEKSKGLLISTIESTIIGIDFFQGGETEKAIQHINEQTNDILIQYIQEIVTVMNIETRK